MPSLLPTGVPVPVPVGDALAAMITNNSAFAMIGAANPSAQASANMGGDFVTAPRWNQDTTASEKVDGSSSTPGSVGAYGEVFPIARRKRVRGIVSTVAPAMGLASDDAAAQPLMEQSAVYWAQQIDNAFLHMLTGLFDASSGILRSTHGLDIGGTAAPLVTASYSAIIKAATGKLGDQFASLKFGVAHSLVIADLMQEAAAKSIANGTGMLGSFAVAQIGGLTFIPHDNVPTSGSGTYKKYRTILVRPGALWFAWQKQLKEYVQVDAKVPETIYTQEAHFAVGVQGCKWGVTTVNPVQADLETATNYAKATSVDKEIGLVALTTNAS